MDFHKEDGDDLVPKINRERPLVLKTVDLIQLGKKFEVLSTYLI